MTRRVVLLRHGRTAHNAEGRIQGQLDVALDDVGLAQAQALGAVFAAEPPAVVVSSDLSRAAQTARGVCDHVGLPLLLDARLRETHFGAWQGLTGPEVEAAWPQEYAAWRRFEGHAVDGESPSEVAARSLACLEEHLPDSGTLMLVTHGGTARSLVGAATGMDPASWWRLSPLGNTCWSVLVEGDRGWRLERHNTGLGPLVGSPTGATPPAPDQDAAGF